MAVAYGTVTQPGLLSQQYPPPLLPKPGKDNIRLQKLLKRTAKKKASTQASQSATPFRSSLSPVNEASPDLEHSDHFTPPRTPDTPQSFYGNQPPRFTVRLPYQHVASPYPQRAAYGRGARMSPQTVVMPSYSYSQHVTTVSYPSGVSTALGQVPQPGVPKVLVLASSVSEVTVSAAELKKSAFNTLAQTHASVIGPTPYPTSGRQPMIQPLTVLTTLVKPRSPRPTFKATEPSRSPKPMFDVPQIRMYTASTSFYETSRMPPVYDTAGLTAIGSTVPHSKMPAETNDPQRTTPTSDIKRTTPTAEVRGATPTAEVRGATPTAELRRAPPTAEVRRAPPTAEVRRATPTAEVKRATPTAEVKRATPTAEIREATPTAELKRATPTAEIRGATPTAEVKRAPPTAEVRRAPPTAEVRRAPPTAEVKRATPTAEIRVATPTAEVKRATPTAEIRGATPTAEVKRATPTAEIRGAPPTAEVKRAPPTAEVKRAPPTAEVRRAPPTAEIRGATPTTEVKRATPTAEIRGAPPTTEVKRATPTAEIRAKTPTYEFQTSRTAAGRPKTPAYHVTRAATPVFEISRPNPLLFAVSPVTVEPERSRMPQTVLLESSSSASQSVKTTAPPERTLNGGIQSDMISSEKPVQPSITKSKSEPDLSSRKSSVAPVGSEEPKAPITPAFSGQQRAKTPTYEASRLMTTSPGYKRPKTPTYGTLASDLSPVGFQRPTTAIQVSQKSKSSYRGLTPAEYTAYGGIKTYSPAFGISGLMTSNKEEVKDKKEISEESKGPNQEPSVKRQSAFETSTIKKTPKDVAQSHQRDEKVAATPSIPFIVVTQASDSPGAMLTQETSMGSGQVAAKRETVIQETPKAKLSAAEKQKGETPIQETKPKTPEAKRPVPKGGDQDPLKAVKKLLGKNKVPTAKQKSITETNADVAEQKEPAKPVDVNKITSESSKPSTAAFPLPVKVPAAVEDNEQDRKTESPSGVHSVAEKKEGDQSLPKAEPILKAILKPKGVKSKASGWSRLKKHMVVEQEEPKFPQTGSEKEVTGKDQKEIKTVDEKAGDKPSVQKENQTKDTPKAAQMWDAVLFQMFSSKENIMHQIELNKSETEKKEEGKDELKEIPSFAYRLPVLLFSPKFDAKKLKEAASRPVTKISTVFEMGLIGRKGKDEEPKDFNRTARGFTAS
ncbi:cell wall protein DAN4 [Archocentrus centrarchus]|uniref:cell wall protein DAN4 n=1 Tax=Archocentrus centrarchus TaxID=63155 RepID=UPI0011E9F31B|nr:cell wall protein DAN4-like [Archocentrus centrarchus]